MTGYEAKPPKITCEDELCPWHGHLKVRGRIFKGIVISDKNQKTVTVMWEYNTYIPKYERYERRKTKVYAHNPSCINAKTGDRVKVAECRPLSKTKRFVVIEILKKG